MATKSSKAKPKDKPAEIKFDNLGTRAQDLSVEIANFLPNERSFWFLGEKLLDASTSIGKKMIDAEGSTSKKDIVKFVESALKSANETVYWCGLIKDSYRELESQCDELISETKEIIDLLNASISSLKK